MSVSYKELIESMKVLSPCCGSELNIDYKSQTTKMSNYRDRIDITPILVCSICGKKYKPEIKLSPIVNLCVEVKFV